MTIHDVEQRSPEWHALRCGRLTGSGANAILAVRKRGTGELAIRTNLRQRLVVERLTGLPADELPYLPKDMQHGVVQEPEAFAAYEAANREIVTRVGFVSHDELMAGCSPDGYVGDWEGAIELKCPSSATHLEYLQAGVIPEEYFGQCVHTLWMVPSLEWIDFVSFDPRFPLDLRLFQKRMERSAIDIQAYDLAARLFLDEVDKQVSAVRPEAMTA